jgi:1,4-dihydroxy-2-naphthoyl-CoA synthase
VPLGRRAIDVDAQRVNVEGEHSVNAFETIRYEMTTPSVARIVLAREEQRNAQDKRMTYKLNAAFDQAPRDPVVKVIVLLPTVLTLLGARSS